MAKVTLPDGSALDITEGTTLKQLAEQIGPGLAKAAVAAGANGLFLEVHPEPETALSDGYQSMRFDQFADMMVRCRKVADAVGKTMG